ncbi:MAG TPA: hypothetical protein GXZ40_04445, partial [Bacteroidales bacterium]|nr:hypothetical protein [Bacteroidales bacterium]
MTKIGKIIVTRVNIEKQVEILNFSCVLREGAGGKPARAEAAGDAAAKKRACKLFLPPCV